MPDIHISGTLLPHWVQIYTHGCHYTCPIKEVNGEWLFRFKGDWFKVDDYVDEHTYINNTFYKP